MEYTAGLPPDAIDLADEMMEDPRCRFLALGEEGEAAVLFTVWDREVVEEVRSSLRQMLPEVVRVRRLELRALG